MATSAGTKADPWVLKTPPGTSEYTMYRDEASDPPTIVCQVGGTKLLYDARAINDLHTWLMAHGDWMPLGGADEQKTAPKAQSRLGAGLLSAPPEARGPGRRTAPRDAPHISPPRPGRRGRAGLCRASLGRRRGPVSTGRSECAAHTTRTVIDPIRLTFEVDCPVEHAFEVWTARIAQWWPNDHTVSVETEGLAVSGPGRGR